MTSETVTYIAAFISLGLLMLMQVGFLCLESGIVRSKNSINVAAKNLMDLVLVIILFWLFGYSIMFGHSYLGLMGSISPFQTSEEDLTQPLFFLFQAMFAATAVTIVSGTVAERCSLKGYMAIVLIITVVIYPVVGHWAWGGLYTGEPSGWLEQAGFYDFAGASVVHVVGGGVALSAAIIIGPRLGYKEKLSAGFTGHSMVITILGYLFLWLGWFGFNGGSAVFSDIHKLPIVLLNTALAGAGGGLAILIIEKIRGDKLDILLLANGILAGLVSVTAGCNIYSGTAAIVVGVIGGTLSFLASRWLDKHKIDDPVKGIPVHFVAGFWGTLAVALLSSSESTPANLSRVDWFLIQLLGVVVIAAWAVIASWLLLKIYNRFQPLRVSEEDERNGLNVAEHGAKTELYDLLIDMREQQLSGNFSNQVRVEPHTEIGQVAFQYNQVAKSFNSAQAELYQTIDDLEKTRQALNEACIKAEKANEYKSVFLANMSHEILTPINGVIGMAELLLLEDMPDKQSSAINTINASAKGLMNVINDILDFSKEKTDKPSLESVELDIHDFLQETLGIFQVQAQEKNLTLSFEFQKHSPRRIYGDPAHLRQIIINLLGNAIKFTDEGSISLRANVISHDEEDRLTLEVQDTGIGMTREQCGRVFMDFQQTDNTSRQYGGIGLGLSITQQLVTMMGGEIKVFSKLGKGSCFELFVKTHIVGKDRKNQRNNNSPDLQIADISSLKSLNHPPSNKVIDKICSKVLVAEDNGFNQKVTLKYLEKLGIHAEVVDNGLEAVEYCQKQTPQLILIDCEMPVMDGLTATKAIRSQNHHLESPIIIGLSAHAMAEHKQRGLDSGMNAYLTKPATLDQLRSVILEFFKGLPEH